MQYWLMKSEPDEFGIDDLRARPGRTEPWDGVRNYQARNMLRDEMKVGDLAFFYHSNCDVPGIAGVVRIASESYPDPTAFDPDDPHFDPKGDRDAPRWYLVDVEFVRKTRRVISLAELKADAGALGDFALLKRGNRLSVMPVSAAQWKRIHELEKHPPPAG